MTFESCVVVEDLRYTMIVLLYKGKGERMECNNYRSISLLSIFQKVTGFD